MDVVQAQDVVSVKIIGLQKKWHSICQRLHQVEPYLQVFVNVFINYKLMEQILKASCFLDSSKTAEWINKVLGEALYKFRGSTDLVLTESWNLTAELPEKQLSGNLLTGS